MSSLDEKFKEEHKDYEHPLKTLKQKLAKMSQTNKEKYFKHASKIKKDDVHLEIMNEITRDLFEKLADEENKPVRNLYKATLLFLKDYRGWINDLARFDSKDKEDDAEEIAQELDKWFDN